MITGPATATVLCSAFPLRVIPTLDVLGAFFTVTIPTAVDTPAISKEDKDKTSLLGEIREGYSVMYSMPGVRGLLVIDVLYAVIYFPIGALYSLVIMSYPNGGIRESGLVETVLAMGTLVGPVSLGM